MTSEFVTSHDWRELKDRLLARRDGFLNLLTKEQDLEKIRRYQVAISETDYLLGLPKELMEEQNEKEI